MQKFVVALMALWAISLGAVAAPDAALGTPLIVKETGGGHVPPEHFGWGEKISVYSNGKVIESYRTNGDAPWVHTTLAVLSKEVLDSIAGMVESLEPGELVFPDDPECTDLPVTTYSAKNSAGVIVQFAQIMACRLGILDGFYDAYRLQRILDGLDALGTN